MRRPAGAGSGGSCAQSVADTVALGSRQDEGKGRAGSGRARDFDAAAVKLDERLDEAKAQPDAALAELVIPGGVAKGVETGEERLEKVLLVGIAARPRPGRSLRRGTPRLNSAAGCASRRIVPPSGVNLTALARRLIRTSAILLGSASIESDAGIEAHRDRLPAQLEIRGKLLDDALGDRTEARRSRFRATGVKSRFRTSLSIRSTVRASRPAAAPMRSTH